MLWRLPAPVCSLLIQHYRKHYSTAAKPIDPLKILFCGSDSFSIASLRALSRAKHEAPELIESIHVVHRPAKYTGRGLKVLKEVPIQKVATQELNLSTNAIDTFTGWIPPIPIDLVIAVSFGLFVPPRILNLARYGGLNVHPSLLPDLRGPAPIHHALLKGRQFTGVSIQTLHPKQFDGGIILDQTPSPGIQIAPETTPAELTETLGHAGANMLVNVLKSRTFVPPLEDVGWYSTSDGAKEHAGKITKQDRFIDFSKVTLQEVLAVHCVLGDPWTILPNGDRLILNEIKDSGLPVQMEAKKGIWVPEGSDIPHARTSCGGALRIEKSTYQGGKTGQGNARLIRLLSQIS